MRTPRTSTKATRNAQPRGVVPPPPTHAEMDARREFVDKLLRAGAMPDQIEQLTRKQFGLDKRTVDRLLADLRKLLREELLASDNKVEQLARLRNDLLVMRSSAKPNRPAIVATEKLIAEIEGNLAPRRLQHDIGGIIPDAIGAVLASMTPEELEAAAEEQRELERKLASIPTTAEPVASNPA